MIEDQYSTYPYHEHKGEGFVSTQLQDAAAFYGLTPFKKSRRNPRGLVNTTHEIDDLHFLTIYHGWTVEELEAVSELTNGMRDSIPIARPIRGRNGYVFETDPGHALLCPRLPGKHFLGRTHTEKPPIPPDAHKSLARFFWDLQEELTGAPVYLKTRLTRPSRPTIGRIPDVVPDIAKPLEIYAPKNLSDLKYPELIHDDLERQNILFVGNTITGVVDLDSIHSGDILYEFGHFLFNNVFCDPKAQDVTVMMYINELFSAGVISPEDVPALYGHMYRFAISDIADFQDLIDQDQKVGKAPVVNLNLLVEQYSNALRFASNFFKP